MVATSPNGHATRTMRLKLLIWRQASRDAPGKMVPYEIDGITPDMSFLEMLDVLNESLIKRGEEPVAFDSDCREGICGNCGVVINGRAHGPNPGTTVCQLHMRFYRDGDQITIEPWRARAFPIVKDLCVDRSSLDRVIAAGGYISAGVGGAPDGNTLPVPRALAEAAMDSAACIQCGACVAQCKNAAAHLFVGAKISHLSQLPQGAAERATRATGMVNQMDHEAFGSCSNEGECQAVCPKGILMSNIARMVREYTRAALVGGP
jgi:succinate dehydrogenase / fumarate reductase iron-sulfur subunit